MKTNIKKRIVRLVKQINIINNELKDHYVAKYHSYEYHANMRSKVVVMTNKVHELQTKYGN